MAESSVPATTWWAKGLLFEITDEDAVKRVVIEGLLESTIENIRGWDRSQPVSFKDMFNQIHHSTQVIAQGAMTAMWMAMMTVMMLPAARLEHCRTPLSYFLTQWRNGPGGAFKMELSHGVYGNRIGRVAGAGMVLWGLTLLTGF